MVSITIVTWNSASCLRECLASVARQDYRDIEVILLDNASTDDTREILREYESRFQVIYQPTNTGFAAGQNQAIRTARGEWILCLNPDVLLRQDFVSELVAAARAHPEAGAVCGKLLRWKPRELNAQTNIIDSAGVYFTRNMRHLDRGAEEIDCGQYDRVQYVFGATGAAVLFRREFIDAVSVDGSFFDEEFFSFREDGDMAWRAQLMGKKFLYTPNAVAWHVRRVTPERRKESAAPHQLALGKEPLAHARQEFLVVVVLAACCAGVVARCAGLWLCPFARSRNDFSMPLSVASECATAASSSARHHSIPSQSIGSRVALVVQ